MFCWSCGAPTAAGLEKCAACGAHRSAFVVRGAAVSVQPRDAVRMCPGCGYLGEGMPYFKRSTHAALLVTAGLLTYGVGALAYWLVKRHARVCPTCGIAWERALPLEALPSGATNAVESGLWLRTAPSISQELPRGGVVRRTAGVILAILAVFLLGMGIVEVSAATVVASIAVGLVGVSSFAWGWQALQKRREGLLRSLQTQVLRLAAARDGRLTATDVASDLGVTLPAAERVLFSLDDGFRVRSEVTDEGLLLFEFPEIQARSIPPVSETTPRPEESEHVEG